MFLEKPDFSEDRHAATPAAHQIHFPFVAPGERSRNPRKLIEGISLICVAAGDLHGIALHRRDTL
jgi:hypothetical protein